jgi:ATP synthase F1 delta subunit
MISQEMISVALEEGAMALFPKLAKDFNELAMDHANEVYCIVTSAEALAESHTKKIRAKLQGMVDSDQSIIVSYELDASMLGGLTLRVGSKFQDLSVRSAILAGEQTLRAL